MSNSAYYLVRFHANCEECGRRFEGVFWRMVPNSDGAMLASVMSSGLKNTAEYVDARNTKKGLEKRLREKRWSELSSGGITSGVSYTMPHTHFCPHCGARQSWDPMVEPKEPEKTSGRIGYAAIGVFFCGIVGMLIGLFAMAFVGETIALMVCTVLGVVFGAVFGYWIGGLINKDERESYAERRAAYERDKTAYEEYQKSLANRTVRNEPVPEFETGCFGPCIPAAADIGKFNPKHCPHCGRKLEGKYRVGSVEASRAAVGKCPHCGEMLPADRRLHVSTE